MKELTSTDKLTKYHTTRRPDGQWETRQEGADEPAIVAPTKRQVLEENAKQLTNASVRIHRADGKFQEERTYPRSQDPRKSKG
jgi:hypothetical protein